MKDAKNLSTCVKLFRPTKLLSLKQMCASKQIGHVLSEFDGEVIALLSGGV